MDIQIVAAPLVGGLIGLITNSLAIKMLFRPLKPLYIWKFKIPFTPGLIPKEKTRIAKAIGEIVSRDLLDKETLENTLLSDQMKNNLYARVDEMLLKYAGTEETIGTIAEKFISNDVMLEKLKSVNENFAEIITRKAIEQNIGASIVEYAYDGIISKTKPMLKALTGNALKTIKEPFAAKINEMIDEKSRPLIEKFIAEQTEEILKSPLKDIIEKHQNKIPGIKDFLWGVYTDMINKKLIAILETLNISKVIYEKINDLDLMELEKMIMSLMKRELNALIWLGGFLGLLMGFINVMIGFIK